MRLLRDKIKRDTYMCKKICNMIARGDLRDDHPQQRKSGQWTNETRDNFIVTVIKNEDFDPIKICEQLTDDGVILWLIDGLQRSTTIENFKSGKFALGKNIDPYIIEWQETEINEEGEKEYRNVSYDLRGKNYSELPEKLKEDFDNCPVYVVKHLDCTDEEVGRHIVRYNSGRPMVAAQKISAYMYNTARYVKELSGHAFFSDCANYSATADRNGTVDKVVSESIMGLNFFDAWNKNAMKIGKFLNQNASEDMFDDFSKYLDRLLKVVKPETGELFSQKNALIWFMLFDKFSHSGLSDEKFGQFLQHFDDLKNVKVKVEHGYELVKGSKEYTKYLSFAELDACKSTKDKGVIEDKLHILETVMNEFLHISDKNSFGLEEVIEETKEENIEESENEISVMDFVKGNVDPDITQEDIEQYEEVLEELTLNVDNSSQLLDEDNYKSLIALVAYSFSKEIDLDNWIVDYFSYNNTYLKNQKANYLHMKQDLEGYLSRNDKEKSA